MTQPAKNLRYERKSRIERTEKQQVLYHIKHHPAFFRSIFSPRQVNNIYFDTLQFKYYEANVMGVADRKKVRIRWYSNSLAEAKKPQLEIKMKSGLVGDKLVFPLPDFVLPVQLSADFFIQLAITANIPSAILNELKLLQPVLLNTYRRSYFQSIDKKFRLTLDEDMAFYTTKSLQNRSSLSYKSVGVFILELKYALENDAAVAAIFQHLPYRLSKNSKYVNGIELLKLV